MTLSPGKEGYHFNLKKPLSPAAVEQASQFMTSFITEDFLLQNEYASQLYHSYAKDLPIIDYHCHLSPADISQNRKFENLTKIWLEGDHYKWRAMRTLGVPEKYVTGNASDEEKFSKWASTVPYTLRNPLYHWTHLELKRYFDEDRFLKPETGKDIYDACAANLKTPPFFTRSILKKMRVEVVCTTDDPADGLEHHQQLKAEGFEVSVLPAFRPDKAYAIENPITYRTYIEKLGSTSGISIDTYDSLIEALHKRIDFFHDNGCRLADHGLEHLFYYGNQNGYKLETLFQKVMKSETPDQHAREHFKYAVLLELCRRYHKKGWTQQFHLGALRNTNERMLRSIGPDTGFDSIGDFRQAVSLAGFLNELDRTNQLTKTILYNINPRDNEVMATMVGNFSDGSVKGKIQFGSAWWFLDQKEGMENQINTLSNLGLLSCFIGMLTDSRSFLSFPRHEYFRRVLCNLIGKDVKNGELPWDEVWLGKIVSDVCYNNAKAYFGF